MNQPYEMLMPASALRDKFQMQLYKNNASSTGTCIYFAYFEYRVL